MDTMKIWKCCFRNLHCLDHIFHKQLLETESGLSVEHISTELNEFDNIKQNLDSLPKRPLLN